MPEHTVSISIPVPSPRARWLAAGVAIGLLVAVVASPLLTPRTILAVDPGSTANEHTITVSGTGKVVLSPDVADLRLGVSVTAKTVKAARDAAATSMTAVVASLRKLGIAEKDIQTTIVSLQPVYDYSGNGTPPKLTGYSFTNSVAVTIHDLAKVGDAIDDGIVAGATTLDGVTFRVEDPAAAAAEARTAAMAEAKAKAQALASAAGVSIAGVASISETVAPIPYPMYYNGLAAAREAGTPVQPGTTDVTVSVTVVYLIG